MYVTFLFVNYFILFYFTLVLPCYLWFLSSLSLSLSLLSHLSLSHISSHLISSHTSLIFHTSLIHLSYISHTYLIHLSYISHTSLSHTSQLLKGVGSEGITIALLEKGHPGLRIGDRHDPLMAAFMNGTVEVFNLNINMNMNIWLICSHNNLKNNKQYHYSIYYSHTLSSKHTHTHTHKHTHIQINKNTYMQICKRARMCIFPCRVCLAARLELGSGGICLWTV